MAEFLEFLTLIFSPGMFPYTVLLALVVLYWMVVIVGALDIEVLEFLSGSTDGVLDGAGESLEGAAEGLGGAVEGLEGAAEGIDGGAAEGLEGAAEGLDGAAEGVDGAAEGASGGGILSGLLGFAGVGSVPLTIILSVLVLLMWLFALILSTTLPAGLRDVVPPLILWFVNFGLIFVICFVVTAFLLRPFRRVFVLKRTRGHHFLVGKVCRIKSGRVTSSFGQAELRVDDSFLLISVRSPEDAGLRRGDEAVITDYDEDHDSYEVTKL